MKSAKAFRAGCLPDESSPSYFCVTPNLIELLSMHNEMFPKECVKIDEGNIMLCFTIFFFFFTL